MSALILPHRWTRQPQVPVGIDWSNPLTQGLVDVFLPTAGRQLLGQTPRVLDLGVQPAFAAGPQGVGLVTNVSTYYAASSSRVQSIKEATLLAVANPAQVSLTTSVILGYGSSSSTNPILFLGQATTSGALTIRARDTAGTSDETLQVSSGIADWVNGAESVLVGTRSESAGITRIWLNGSQRGTATPLATGAVSFDRTAVGGLQRATFGQGFSGAIRLAASWNRALSPAELKSISDNPWQLFAPVERRLFVVASSGGAAALAASESPDVLAATGGVSTSGSLAASESPDVFAASGSAGNTGAMSASESADVFASTGSVATTGAFAAAESADAFASTGNAGNSGALTATEVPDAFASSGAVSVVGSVAATESADAFASSGAVATSGNLDAVEGQDTASVVSLDEITGSLIASEAADAFVAYSNSGVGGGQRKRKIIVRGQMYEVRELEIPSLVEALLRDPPEKVEPVKKTRKVVEKARPVEEPKQVQKVQAVAQEVRAALDAAGLASYFVHLDQIARRILEEQEEDDLETLLMFL